MLTWKNILFVLMVASGIFIIARRFFSSTSKQVTDVPVKTNGLYRTFAISGKGAKDLISTIRKHNPRMRRLKMRTECEDWKKITCRPGMGTSIGEIMSNNTLNEMFSEKFDKIRPDWLRNPRTGRSLELDMMNSRLNIALEYQGMQHYRYPNNLHNSKEAFNEQVYRDSVKRKICQKKEITLLEVPYTIPREHIHLYIYCELAEKWRKSS